jgi:hypothetical protein
MKLNLIENRFKFKKCTLENRFEFTKSTSQIQSICCVHLQDWKFGGWTRLPGHAGTFKFPHLLGKRHLTL